MKGISFSLPFLLFALHCSAQMPDFGEGKKLAERERAQYARTVADAARWGMVDYGYDVKYYRCNWTVDPAVNYIKGDVTMYFQAVRPLKSVAEDLSGQLNVGQVVYHGQAINFSRTDTSLVADLPAALSAQTLDSVTVFYEGAPANTSLGSFVQTVHGNAPIIWTLSEPYGSMDWWPCKNVVNDKADSLDVYITCPSQYTGVSNGMPVGETASGGATTYHWKHRYPISSYLVCMAVSNYVFSGDSIPLGGRTLPIYTYCYPEYKTNFDTSLHLMKAAMELYDSAFGEYPFINEKYGHTQFGFNGGMEHQTNSFINIPTDWLMGHELAHQWFGDKVTTRGWTDIWLHEGFATYLQYLNFIREYPEREALARKGTLDQIVSQPNGAVKVNDTTDVNRIFDYRLSYLKGSFLPIMLEHMLGRDVFFQGLRSYLNDPALAYGNATTQDLQRNLEAVSGKPLAKFFDQWYAKEGYPTYHVTWSQSFDNVARITVSQTTSDSSVDFFAMPLPLRFKGGALLQTVILNDTAKVQSFTVPLDFPADSVLIDPEVWLLSKGNTAQKLPASISGHGKIAMASPVAGDLKFYLHDFPSTSAAVVIVDAKGAVVYRSVVPLTDGWAPVSLSPAKFAKGIYFMRATGGGSSDSKTFLR